MSEGKLQALCRAFRAQSLKSGHELTEPQLGIKIRKWQRLVDRGLPEDAAFAKACGKPPVRAQN
jgi:hypothetical protein